jgi:putative effector of murein hydrolase
MSSSQVIDVVVAVALVAWIIVRQVQPRPVSPRPMLILPLVLVVVGISQVSKAAPSGHSLTSTDVTWLAVDLAVAVVSGLARAFTIRLYEQGGELWRQGTPVTVVLWLASIAARVVIAILGSHSGAGKTLDDGLLLSFGVSLAVQAALIIWRGQQLGIPFAVRDRGRPAR